MQQLLYVIQQFPVWVSTEVFIPKELAETWVFQSLESEEDEAHEIINSLSMLYGVVHNLELVFSVWKLFGGPSSQPVKVTKFPVLLIQFV